MSCFERLLEEFGDFLYDSCCEDGCELKLGEFIHNSIIVDAKSYNENRGRNLNQEICDCIIVCTKHKDLIVSVVELKGKRVHAEDAIKQLENCSKITEEDILKKCDIKIGVNVNFYPLLLSKAIGSMEYKMLRNYRIRFRGKNYKIIRENCGTSLGDIIEKYE